MDPSYLIAPPRAHPSGSASGLDEHHRHQTQNVVHEPWFMILLATMILAIVLLSAAALYFVRRKHQITKEIGHLNGEIIFPNFFF